MNILFIGGTGLISSAAAKLLLERGHALTLLTRGGQGRTAPAGARMLRADVNDTAEVKRQLSGEYFDAVVDWVIFEPAGIGRDIALFEGRTGQYVFISTAATYQRPVSHYIIDESTPQRNPGWDYAENKIACEARLMKEYRERGFPATIVRPSHTYGPTSIPFAVTSWAKPWTIVDRMLRGRPVIVPGDGTSLWTLTHCDDFARGIAGLLGNGQAIGHAFHITSDEVRTWDQYLAAIARASGAEPRPIHIASEAIARFLPEQRGGLLGDTCNSYVLDNSKIKRFVPGYKAVVNFDDGIRRTIQHFRAHPEMMGVDEELNARMDRLIEKYEGFLAGA